MEVWDIYFATIVGMSYHPGYNREETYKLTIDDCAEIADAMIEERDKRCQSHGQ